MSEDVALSAPPPRRRRLAVPLGVPQRLHPASPLIDVVRALPGTLSGLIPALVAIGWTGRGHLIVPAIIAIALVAGVGAIIRFTRFRWTLGEDAVSIDSGVIAKQHRTIPYERLQDLHIEQRALDRLFGLAHVRFDTGGGAGADASLDSIDAGLAEALRAQLRDVRASALPTAEHNDSLADAPHGRLIFAMSSGRVFLSGLFAMSFTFVAIAAGLFQTFDGFIPDRWIERWLPDSAAVEAWFAAATWLLVPLGIAAALAVGLASGVIRSFLTDHGFTLERVPRGFRRRRGLITRSDVTIPIKRVQAARLAMGIVERRLGYGRLSLRSLGGQATKASDDGMPSPERRGQDVAPFATMPEIDTILHEVALDRAGYEEGAREGWTRPPLRATMLPAMGLAMFSLLLGTGSVLVPQVARLPLEIGAGVVGAVALLVGVAGWVESRTSGWRIVGDVLHTVEGFFERVHHIVPLRSVHSAEVRQGPIARALGLARIKLGVPGPVGADGIELIDLPARHAQAIRAAVLR